VIIETPSLHPADAGAPPHPPGIEAADGLALRANKLDLLERLADDLAHEIKNPLHSMVINLEVLKRRVARADAADEVQRYIGVLAGELERVNRRIELLLRLSRPGRGAENTTLNELAEEVLELIQLEARHHEVQVDFRPEGGMARVHVPREPSRQVILNLVLEMIDRMDRGATLRIRLAEEQGESLIAVADSGSAVVALNGEASPRLAAAYALAAAVGGRVEARDDGGLPALVFALPLARAQG
jgi:signal transduction histidine kinase